MQNCKVCDTVSEKDVCSDVCQKIIDDAIKRIFKQNKQYRIIFNTCKDCGRPRDKQKQYCGECIILRRREQKARSNKRKRPPRYCKNEKCGILIEKLSSSSQKYCSDACRPKPIHVKKEKKIPKEVAERDRYKGTVSEKWIMPRGSKQRKEMGLEYTDYGLCKDSDVGGAFIY